MQAKKLSGTTWNPDIQTSLGYAEATKICTTPPASRSTGGPSHKLWKPVDSVLYEDPEPPAEEEARYLNVASLYPDWHIKANCLGTEDAIFFGASDPETRPPYTLGEIKKAKNLCATCPVAAICLRAALINREEYGVWAGTTRKARKKMLAAIDAGEQTVDDIVANFEKSRG